MTAPTHEFYSGDLGQRFYRKPTATAIKSIRQKVGRLETEVVSDVHATI